MTRRPVLVLAAGVGAVPMLAAGALTGTGWWVAAGLGAASAVGASFDRQFAYVQVLATLAGVVGLVAVGHGWFVPVLVAGALGSIELGAAADRTTVIRRRVPELAVIGPRIALATLLCAAILLLGQLPTVAATGAVLVAAGAAVVGTRVIAR